MQYQGEHLIYGTVGHILVLIAFSSALFAMLSYFFSTKSKTSLSPDTSWIKLARMGFVLHGTAVIGVIVLLFYIMIQRYYEFHYAWEHTNDELPFRYIFAAFWEGQEGSFLLWTFWDVVLGFVLIRTAKDFEPQVMTIVAGAQVILVSMILGFYFGGDDQRIGSNPFALLREVMQAPIFTQADYLSKIKGNGLNVLLQNNWMTIHPPTLFLGFASTIVPFAYAIAGLWTRRHTDWLAPALKWSLFSGAILGTGIVMGGAWAYEALSFGGYWAWDPVENASLVPWLIMVAGIHTALIAKNTGRSITATYIFFILSFSMIVYSTFLTRSGILGETSVHAFTKMGLDLQLVIFVAACFVLGGGLLIARWKGIPSIPGEESAYSKEFWLFMGSLVMLFSAVLITATTSIPVYNKTLGLNLSPPTNPTEHHHKYQLWIALLMCLFSGASQFMRWKEGRSLEGARRASYFKRLALTTLGAAVLTLPAAFLTGATLWQFILLLFAGFFVIISNVDYIISVVRHNWKIVGSAMSHIGLGMMFLGIVYSGGMKEQISEGFNEVELAADGNPQADRSVLVPKGPFIPLKVYYDKDGQPIGNYEVSYTSDTIIGSAQYFNLTYRRRDKAGNVLEQFSVKPNILFAGKTPDTREYKAANPSTEHFLSKDVFSVAVPDWVYEDKEARQKALDSIKWAEKNVTQNDTIYTSKHYTTFEGFDRTPKNPNYTPEAGDIAIGAKLRVHILGTDSTWTAEPIYYIRANRENTAMAEIKHLGLKFRFTHLIPQENKAVIEVAEVKPENAFVVLQALIFPGINLVWVGQILMMIGLSVAMVYRIYNK